MYNTIFNSISYAGGDNRNGWTQKWLTAPIVATSSPLSVLDLKIPKNALIIRAFLNVFTPESTGASKVITVARADKLDPGGTAQVIINSAPVENPGVSGDPALPVPVSGVYQIGEEDVIAYQTGSLDFVELDAEIILQILIGEDYE